MDTHPPDVDCWGCDAPFVVGDGEDDHELPGIFYSKRNQLPQQKQHNGRDNTDVLLNYLRKNEKRLIWNSDCLILLRVNETFKTTDIFNSA